MTRLKIFKLFFFFLSISFFIFSGQKIFAKGELSNELGDLKDFGTISGLKTLGVDDQIDVIEEETPLPEPIEVYTPPVATITPIDLTVSPINLNLETDPGTTVQSSIKIHNNSLEQEHLKIELAKFVADRTGSNPKIMNFTEDDEYKDWLTFERDMFDVNPGEWETIDLTFSPPRYAALAYYYAIVIKRQVDTTQEGATTVTGAPAILVLANVYSPNAIQELQLVDFTSKKRFYEYLPADFEIAVKNSGNIHLAPLGNIFIDKGNKKDIGMISINKANGLILPNSERVYDTSWDEGFPAYQTISIDGVAQKDENGKEIKKLKWDFGKINNFRFGKYTAHLLLVYDNGVRDIPIESEISFWVIPWRLILIALVLIVLISLGIVSPLMMIRRKVKK